MSCYFCVEFWCRLVSCLSSGHSFHFPFPVLYKLGKGMTKTKWSNGILMGVVSEACLWHGQGSPPWPLLTDTDSSVLFRRLIVPEKRPQKNSHRSFLLYNHDIADESDFKVDESAWKKLIKKAEQIWTATLCSVYFYNYEYFVLVCKKY